ncbi:two-component system capsular synthesis response regulator RcsB [Paraburkholderia sp. GAS199]|uniref:response regulator n=1 Tax=Paraburkholderia sp. GAS199 TaxID=3035126 RepID=UPI003D1D53E4
MKLRVILADDHPFVLLGVRAALETRPDIRIVGEASTPAALIQMLRCVSCDVLVTDLAMPEVSNSAEDGLDLVRRIQNEWPLVRIIVMTALTNAAILRTLVSDCAISALSKMESMSELWRAIEASGRGETYVGRSLVELLARQRDETSASADAEPSPRLSRRQAEVIRRFVHGESISEIAEAMDCHRRTVSRKKREAMAALGVANDPGLFTYVRAMGIL